MSSGLYNKCLFNAYIKQRSKYTGLRIVMRRILAVESTKRAINQRSTTVKHRAEQSNPKPLRLIRQPVDSSSGRNKRRYTFDKRSRQRTDRHTRRPFTTPTPSLHTSIINNIGD